jgi:hypothetical protein
MTAVLLVAALAFGAQNVEATPQPTTSLYVKTVPPGATVTVDGKRLGESNDLFTVSAGSHKLTLHLEGYDDEERTIDVRDGQITRVEVTLKKQGEAAPAKQVKSFLSYVGDSAAGQQSYADSGHAVAFQRPKSMKSIVAVQVFGSRYGYPNAPNEDFHIYLLGKQMKVLEHIKVPYRKIERGEMRWYTLEFPAVEVPEDFSVVLWFNATATKGVFVGKSASGPEASEHAHSSAGLPDKGFHKVEGYEWMIRAVVSTASGKQPTYPKVTTYEPEKAADTESTEAMPTRKWTDASGAFDVEAQFAGVEDGKVKLKKADGTIVSVALERLSKKDQEFVAKQLSAKRAAAEAGPRETKELSHDNGQMASKSSIAGGGHAVRFTVEGDSWCVTSVSLHGSRYGMPQPPKEDFRVWICDAKFKPIATFRFPYSSFIRSDPTWKTFRIRPTPVPQEFIVCFGFNPKQTKGVFVSYDNQPSTTSLTGVPGPHPAQPFANGNWLIRCKVQATK